MRVGSGWAALAGVALATCIDASGFVCADSVQCVQGGVQGVCTRADRCSYPAEDCPSAARYSRHAGDELAGQCVPTGDLEPDDATGVLVLARIEYTHTTDGRAYSYFPAMTDLPVDLTAPVDYANGRLHARVEVRSKPSDLAVEYQVCVYQDPVDGSTPRRSCSEGPLRFTAPDVLEVDEAVAELVRDAGVDWTEPLVGCALIVKDGEGVPVDDRYGLADKWIGAPDFSLYYPMEVAVTIVITAPGAEFPGWAAIDAQ